MYERTIIQNRADGYALIVGALAQNELHSHFSAHLILSLTRPVEVRTADGALIAGGVAIGPWVPHQLIGPERAPALILSATPLAGIGRSLVARLHGRGAAQIDEAVAAIREAALAVHQAEEIGDSVASLVDALTVYASAIPSEGLAAARVDLRVLNALALVAANTEGFLPAGAAAAHVGLSESRFLHLLKEQVGMSYRKMQRWVRLATSFESVCTGGSLTETAHQFGFADSAHFSRAFHEAFGMAPSVLMRNSRFVQV